MIEVEIDSIRVSLMSQQRIVVLKDLNAERYLPIWIGPFEADAIHVELQDVPPPRPLTHDLLKSTIQEMGGRVVHIFINDLRRDVYYARLVIEVDGKNIEVDSRPSDAIALAVRSEAPIFVAESVMMKASVEPEDDVEQEALGTISDAAVERAARTGGDSEVDDSKLSAFADFVDSLNLDDLEDED